MLVRLDPDDAFARLSIAIAHSNGCATTVARRLGCSRSTLHRWIVTLAIAGHDLRAVLADARAAA
jgi:transposase-like protein